MSPQPTSAVQHGNSETLWLKHHNSRTHLAESGGVRPMLSKYSSAIAADDPGSVVQCLLREAVAARWMPRQDVAASTNTPRNRCDGKGRMGPPED